jgi:hypothetical protein
MKAFDKAVADRDAPPAAFCAALQINPVIAAGAISADGKPHQVTLTFGPAPMPCRPTQCVVR